MVESSWPNDSLVLGQIKTDEKSNGKTAVLELLDSLSIKDSIITADAMCCQKDIAKKIIDKEAIDLGHGRIETRRCSLISDFQFIAEDSDWANLKTVVKIERKREFKNSDRETETITQFYITSLNGKPKELLHLCSDTLGNRKQVALET